MVLHQVNMMYCNIAKRFVNQKCDYLEDITAFLLNSIYLACLHCDLSYKIKLLSSGYYKHASSLNEAYDLSMVEKIERVGSANKMNSICPDRSALCITPPLCETATTYKIAFSRYVKAAIY